MTFEEIKQGEETYIMHTYGRFPIALDHGKGATLWDTEGKKYNITRCENCSSFTIP